MTLQSPGNPFLDASAHFLNPPTALVFYAHSSSDCSGAVMFRSCYVTRHTLTLIPFVCLAFVLSLAAQQSPLPADAPQPSSAEKVDNPQKKNQAAPVEAAPAGEAASFDERAAAEVLGILRNGLESHSQRLMLSAFDPGKMEGFLTFEDQIEAYFTRYEAFRVTLRIIQTSEENNRGVILADFQVESDPRGGGRISRRQGQLRFELERVPKGWKIVDFDPRGFFS
jgi:hypothetical protein